MTFLSLRKKNNRICVRTLCDTHLLRWRDNETSNVISVVGELSALWISQKQPNLPISVTHVCDVNADKAKQTASAGCKSLSSFDDIHRESNDFVTI